MLQVDSEVMWRLLLFPLLICFFFLSYHFHTYSCACGFASFMLTAVAENIGR